MANNLFKRIVVSIDELNDILKQLEDFGLFIVKLGYGQPIKSIEQFMAIHHLNHPTFSTYAYIVLKDTKVEVSCRYIDKTNCTFICDLNGESISDLVGQRCYMEQQKAYKIPKASEYNSPLVDRWVDTDNNKYICTAKPILGYNKSYQGMELVDVYEYDINSAYSSQLLDKIPDLYNPIMVDRGTDESIVREGQVGFILDSDCTMVPVGYFADIIFNLIDTPDSLKEYHNKWYSIKKESEGNVKQDAKDHLNFPIGYSQRTNPFFRSYVIGMCNKKIKSIMDKDTLLWNTDAIFSRVRRTDLEIGNEIGQFKEILIKRLVYIGNTYQVDLETPKYRGICKEWFKEFERQHDRPYDLLKDKDVSIIRANKYELNWDTLQLEEVIYG